MNAAECGMVHSTRVPKQIKRKSEDVVDISIQASNDDIFYKIHTLYFDQHTFFPNANNSVHNK